MMADIGAQDQPIIGFHPKNSIKLVPVPCLALLDT